MRAHWSSRTFGAHFGRVLTLAASVPADVCEEACAPSRIVLLGSQLLFVDAPATVLPLLGLELDSVSQQIHLPPEKLREI